MSTLHQDQLDFFKEHGYLVLENVFTPDEVARMQAESDYILELIANSSLANERLSRRMDWRRTSAGAVDMPFDTRNGPTRLREAPYEREYLRMKERGEFADRFEAPA